MIVKSQSEIADHKYCWLIENFLEIHHVRVKGFYNTEIQKVGQGRKDHEERLK